MSDLAASTLRKRSAGALKGPIGWWKVHVESQQRTVPRALLQGALEVPSSCTYQTNLKLHPQEWSRQLHAHCQLAPVNAQKEMTLFQACVRY